MSTLNKFTLSKDDERGDWELTKDGTNRVLRRFPTKEAATKGGALEKALGKSGGSVKIRNEGGRFEEERTFPRDADPRESPG